jgi:hypothetical protein
MIFQGYKERKRRKGDLPRSRRNHMKTDDLRRSRSKEHGEQVISQNQEEKSKRTGDIPRSGRKNTKNR